MLDRKQCRARYLELLSLWSLQLDTDDAVTALSLTLGGVGGLSVAVCARAETQALPVPFFPAGRAQVGGRNVAFLVDHARHESHVLCIAGARVTLQLVDETAVKIGDIRARTRLVEPQVVNGA